MRICMSLCLHMSYVFTHELCVNTVYVCICILLFVCLFFVGGGETLRKLR